MKSSSWTVLAVAGLLAFGMASTGCAKKDVDQLRTELAEVKAMANEAKTSGDEAVREAQAARSMVGDAKATADDAKATADEAKAMAQDNSDRIDRMFKKAMSK
jgi:hypothetical protein